MTDRPDSAFPPPGGALANPYASPVAAPVEPVPPQYGAAPGYPAAPFAAPPAYGVPGVPGGYGPPPPVGRRGANPLAVIALVLSIVALVASWIEPYWPGALAALVALGLGIAGIVAARPGVRGGKGMGIGAVVVASFALLTAGMAPLLADAGDAFAEGFAEEWEAGEDPFLEDEGTSLDLPPGELALGESATVGDYDVTVLDIDMDADEEVADASRDNPWPLGRYVTATLEITYVGEDLGLPFDDLVVSYPGVDDWRYEDRSCYAATDAPMWRAELEPGETAEVVACIDVRPAAIGPRQVLVESLATTYYEGRLWVAE